MSRMINTEIKDLIYHYLREQWFFYEKKPFSCSLAKIAEGIKLDLDPTMVRFYIKRLELENKIKITGFGPGRGNSNEYEIVETNGVNEEKKEEIKLFKDGIAESDDLAKELFEGIKKLRQLRTDANKFHYLINSLQQLEPFGTTNDGDQLFIIPAMFNLKEMIEGYEKGYESKNENKNESENNFINPINENRLDIN